MIHRHRHHDQRTAIRSIQYHSCRSIPKPSSKSSIFNVTGNYNNEQLLDKSLLRRSVDQLADKLAIYHQTLLVIEEDNTMNLPEPLDDEDQDAAALTRRQRYQARREAMEQRRLLAEQTRQRILNGNITNTNGNNGIHSTVKTEKRPPEHVKEKFRVWAVSFCSLDPRIRIHRFFQGIAQKGELKLEEAAIRRQSTLTANANQQPNRSPRSEREILESCFNLASVFTVWRPCSNQAIRKMMQGSGVGKGLDIKGKSAKFGKCSGYVPFLQLHTDKDKKKIDLLPRDARFKIFYSSESTRDLALKIATQVSDEMVKTVQSLDDSLSTLQQRESLQSRCHSSFNNGDDENRTKLQRESLQERNHSSFSNDGNYHMLLRESLSTSNNDRHGSLHMPASDLHRRDSDQPPHETSFEPIYNGDDETTAKRVSTSQRSDDDFGILDYCVASQLKQEWEMKDPSVTPINEYATDSGVYGMELTERLFWEAFVKRQEQHCQHWQLLSKAKENKNSDNHNHVPSTCCSFKTDKSPQKGFAEQIMEQMVQVSECQDEDLPVINWIDEANPEEEEEHEIVAKDRDVMVSTGTLPEFTMSTDTLPAYNRSGTDESVKPRRGRRKKKPSSWSFVIVNQDRFIEQVLNPIRQRDKTFSSKYSCFVGELRRSGFEEQTTGSGFARFRHRYFQKDRPELCTLIGSEHDTGRQSMPIFQDANFKSLRKKARGSGHLVVLWCLEDGENPLCPHNLLMAYEENERVTPVVSDFDGFLVGTKRIHFDKELPPEQVELMKCNIRTAQDILEGKATGNSWAAKWQYAGRDHFAAANKQKGMPRFGYGDAKSYRLIEAAVTQMAKFNGAVRHGAECFNFEYPQEMDPEFLVISDTIEGKVRWKKVDSVGLHYFLTKRIEDRYTFPLNPKWVLCDPGWSKLYDMLINSESPNIQTSLDVWFPPKSGIRSMIEAIQKKHPTGLSFDDSDEANRPRPPMGLPIVSTYTLQSPDSSEHQHPVKLLLDKGSVVQFSRPGLRSGIVCATNESCVPVCGGVTQAVGQAGGRQLLKDAIALPLLSETSFGPVRCVTGDAKIVVRGNDKNYGNLDVGYVIYAVGPSFGETFSSDYDIGIKDNLLRTAYQASLERAKEHGLQAVALSLLSAGKRGSRWDPHRALRIAMRTLCDFRDFGSLREIHVCAFTAEEVSALQSIAKEFGMTTADKTADV